MLVVLSQRIDFESGYADELFKTYHYPSAIVISFMKAISLFIIKEIVMTENSALFWNRSCITDICCR